MASQYVSISNGTSEMLYLCVRVDGGFQEWELTPGGGQQTVDSTTTDYVQIQNTSGQCPS